MEQLDEQSKLRKYILNDIGENERAVIEERLLTDDEYFEEVSMAEENLIQDYADQNLAPDERARFEKYFLCSEENRQKVNFARALRKYVSESKDSTRSVKKPGFLDSLRAFFSTPVPAALAVLAIVGVVSFFIWKNSSKDSEVLAALNKFQKNSRTTEARITGFDYAPKIEGTRGNNKNESLEFTVAKARAAEEVLKNENAKSLHELGIVYLAENNLDDAIKQFEKALKKEPENAKIHNDLGVALIEKARIQEEGRLENLTKASEEFSRAIEMDENLLEAYFNQALCIQILNLLPNQAKEAWQKYLQLDSTSRWAEEARKNLEKLETNKPVSKTKEQILQEFLEAKQTGDREKAWQILSGNRDLGSGKLIPQQLAFLFIDSKLSGNESKAGEILNALVYAGRLEEEKAGDLFWKVLADYYSKITGNKILATKKAHDLLKDSAKLRIEGNLDAALAGFQSAKNIFVENRNLAEEKICDNWIAAITFQLTKLQESNELFIDLAEFSEKNKFQWLATQSYVRLTYGITSQNKHSKSIEYGLKALKLAEKTNDVFNLKRIFSSLAYDYKCLGQYELSLYFSEKSFALGALDAASSQRWEAIQAFTEVLIEMKLSRTSILFQNEALSVARGINDSLNEQLSLMYLGTLYSSIGKYAEAEKFFRTGIEKAETFESEKARKKALAFTNLKYASLNKLLGNCESAVKLYDYATNFYENSEFQLHNYEAHKGKLLCYRQTGNDSQIQNELPVILEIFTKYRKEILEEQNRNSFFDNGQDVYDIAVDYEFGKGNFANAFDYAEESRSRSLLDLQNSAVQISTSENQPDIKFSENLSNPLKLANIQAEMPENTQLLVYSVVPDRVLIWSITKNGLEIGKTEIPAESLEEKVVNYLALVSKNIEPDEQLNLSKQLYQILLSPVKDKLDAAKQILIIPDKILLRLPFAALYAEKYFIEEYKISYSPSANVFLNCSKKGKQLETKNPETVLSIGNPTFNQAEYKNTLQPLPAAANEASEIAKEYVGRTVFTEKSATRQNVKDNLKNADVIHFAGHYVINEKTPLLSSLILAGANKEESNLTNYEIISEKFSRTRLIVLSACDTGIEKYYKGEGMIGASRTFLVADVPLVVASQWSVDSEATKELMIRFHNLRKTEKLSTVEALRQSQIEMLKAEKFKQPFYWAAFAALGGYANF